MYIYMAKTRRRSSHSKPRNAHSSYKSHTEDSVGTLAIVKATLLPVKPPQHLASRGA